MKVYIVEESWFHQGMLAEDYFARDRFIGVFKDADNAIEECHLLASKDHSKEMSEVYDEETGELVGWYSGEGDDEEGYPLNGDHTTWKVRPVDVQ